MNTVKTQTCFCGQSVIRIFLLGGTRWYMVMHGRGGVGETGEHGVSSITTADAHTSAASSRLN